MYEQPAQAVPDPLDGIGLQGVAMSNVHPITHAIAPQPLRVHHDDGLSTHWCHLHADFGLGGSPPAFTPRLLQALRRFASGLSCAGAHPAPSHLVLASDAPVFSLGGDLGHFIRMIRSADQDGLRRYAHACVDNIHLLHSGLRGGLQTVALIQGDAMGGGLEMALACNTIVAEEDVQMGFPEPLFGLFPGMGALPLLARRVPMQVARQLMLDGNTYSSQQLQRMGIVDVLVPRGDGVHAVQELIRRQQRNLAARFAVDRVIGITHPVTHEALVQGVDIWVETAMQLDERNLRTMERLVRAQQRLARPATASC